MARTSAASRSLYESYILPFSGELNTIKKFFTLSPQSLSPGKVRRDGGLCGS